MKTNFGTCIVCVAILFSHEIQSCESALGGSVVEEQSQQDEQGDKPGKIAQPNRSLFDVTVNGKQGFIDRTGRIVIEPTFEKVYPFSEGLAAVQINQKWGFIDSAGRVVIEPQFTVAASFSSGRARVRSRSYTDPWAYIDTSGNIAIEPQFDCAEDFRNGVARVGMETTQSKTLSRIADVGMGCDYKFIDRTGKTIPKPAPEDYATGKANELIRFTEKGLVGYVDATGKVVIKPQFIAGSDFSEGMAGVCKGDVFGYIDRTGRFVITPQFQFANRFSAGLAAVRQPGDKWAFIDPQGETVLPAQYDWVYDGFRDGIARVAVDGRVRYIDKKGDWVW